MGKSSPTKLQAKHVPEIVVLETILMMQNRWAVWVGGNDGTHTKLNYVKGRSARLSDIEEALRPLPPKVVLAKLRNLEKRGLIDGCTCGCSGQFRVIQE